MFAVFAAELFGDPDHRAVDRGAVVIGQVHDARLDDETAELDQVARAPATLDLPVPHVMPRPCRLMPVAHRPVAPERHCCRDQTLMQIAGTCRERTLPRARPTPLSFQHLWFPPAQPAPRPVPRR